ncbi:DUF305 domain-containing protein [Cyanobium sp. ATX 6A2]|uniref:DUF305 domain-containing protein n=1 Tax=Cyanobium sp. ATX 6A2 TaxID=2823700 RepID=UPI0020CE90A7|nr:DUF305 domain-containing protein [Cyanobium sp. ATX 6A2]MCP9889291.1 DUF305 domain-containing protein [Cyanobium sp. ATX 6A2]
MRLLIAPLLLAGIWAAPVLAQADPHQHHQHHDHQHQSAPDHDSSDHDSPSHGTHSHDVGAAGATYDLRWLDAMVQHHTGALRMSEFVFNIGSPGVGALANSIWREQAREIKAMGQWRKAWYPEAPVYPVALRPGGDPSTMAGLERMSAAQIQAMQMMGDTPTRSNRVSWFLEGMIAHHGGALEMAHDALETSTHPTVRRLAREIIVAQRVEIIALRRMLRNAGLDKPEYYKYDSLFSF